MSYLSTLNAAALLGIIFTGVFAFLSIRSYVDSSGREKQKHGRISLIIIGVLILFILVFVLTGPFLHK